MKDITEKVYILPTGERADSVLAMRPILFRVAMADLANYDLANGIAQDTVIELYYSGVKPINMETYAVASLKRNIAKMQARRNKNTVSIEDVQNYANTIADNSDADASGRHRYDMLYNAMDMVDHDKREILVMHVVDKLTIKNIAEQKGYSVAKVKKDLAIVKGQLRKIMNKMKEEDE